MSSRASENLSGFLEKMRLLRVADAEQIQEEIDEEYRLMRLKEEEAEEVEAQALAAAEAKSLENLHSSEEYIANKERAAAADFKYREAVAAEQEELN